MNGSRFSTLVNPFNAVPVYTAMIMPSPEACLGIIDTRPSAGAVHRYHIVLPAPGP